MEECFRIEEMDSNYIASSVSVKLKILKYFKDYGHLTKAQLNLKKQDVEMITYMDIYRDGMASSEGI